MLHDPLFWACSAIIIGCIVLYVHSVKKSMRHDAMLSDEWAQKRREQEEHERPTRDARTNG